MMAPTLSVGAEFDAFGRCVPADNLFSAHAESRRYFRLAKTDIDITSAYRRLIAHLPAPISVSEQAFVNRIARLQKRLATDNCTANLLNGLGVPFLLPKTLVSEIGTLFGEAYLPSVKAAFEVDRPTSRFVNHAPPGLAGKLSVQPGSRHERLIQAMERDDVVGLYFPCLSEYSLPAAVHRVSLLPEYFWLAGGFDTAAAMVAAPDLLARTDGYPPLLWLSGLATDKPSMAYHFEAYGQDLTFNRRAHLGHVAECWWSGVTVVDPV